jgi:HPt (histidine-containing phosphotransfer) domain-containing protein
MTKDLLDEIHAMFLPQFSALANARVTRGLEAATQRDHQAMAFAVRELHALAGEAGLLGLVDVVPLARAAEGKAKQFCTSRSDADADALVTALTELNTLMEHVGAPSPKDGRKA